ncbi:MAG: GFA family protein [Myxococcota bacterium]
MNQDVTWLSGSCHCGAVRYQVAVRPEPRIAVDCNCSMCRRRGFLHYFVMPEGLRIEGRDTPPDPTADDPAIDALCEYRFGTRTARHWFCRTCGIAPFYVPRSHPDGFSVNLRTLESPDDLRTFAIEPFDGEHWEASIAALRKANP